MPSSTSNNVIVFPTFGRAITLDDQGVYYALNTRTGSIHSVFQLTYQDDWYLYQLESNGDEDEMCWTLLSENIDYALNSMTTEQIRRQFAKPEYAEPRGAWQVIKNSKFGFGKFTPSQAGAPTRYAMLVFTGNQMHPPMLLHKAEDALQNTEELAQTTTKIGQNAVEFA